MSNDTRVRLIAEIDATSKGLVDALKQASSAVNDTTGNWKSQFSSLKDATNTIGASVRNLSQLVKEVGNVDMNITGMEEIGKAISTVRGSFDGVKADVDAFVASLSIMKSEAQQFGMPMEEFGRFSEAVKASGVSMSEALQMVKAMQEQIQALANGVPEAQATFDKLGLTIEQLSSNTVSANFEAISQAINSTIPSSERATQNMNLFKSSIDKTMAVAQEYNKTISKQQGSYATDKDVQNATQLQNVIAKLGEQLNGYSNQAREATASTEKMTLAEQIDMTTLQSAIEAQQKYNASLDSTISTLSGVTSAYARLQQSLGNKELFDVDKLANGDKLSKSISTVLNLLKEEKQKMSQVVDIQSRLGAPIDMQYINNYKQHVEQLFNTYKTMQSLLKLGIIENATGDPSKLENLRNQYEAVTAVLGNLRNALKGAINTQIEFEEHNQLYYDTKSAQESIDAFKGKVKEAWDKLGQGIAPVIDTKSIDEASAKIERLKQETDSKIEKQIAVTITGLEDVHTKIQSVKGEMDKLSEGLGDKGVATSFGRIKEVASDVAGVLSQLSSNAKDIMPVDTINDMVSVASENINRIKDNMRTLNGTYKVNLDMSDFERAQEIFERVKGAISQGIDINSVVSKEELEQTSEMMNRLDDNIAKVGIRLTSLNTSSLETLKDATLEATRYIGQFSDGELVASKSTDELSNMASQAIGKLMSIRDVTQGLNARFKLDVDTSRLDDAINSATSLKMSIESIHSKGSDTSDGYIDRIASIANALTNVRTQIEGVNEGVNAISIDMLASMRQEYEDINATIEKLSKTEATSNEEFQRMNGIANDVQGRIEALKICLESISQNYKIDIDTSKLEDALKTVRGISSENMKVNVDATEVNRLNDLFHEARSNVQAINQEVQRGIPVWQPVISQARRFWTFLKANLNPLNAARNSWHGICDLVIKATQNVSHFRHKLDESTKSTQTIGSVLKQATGQIMGMGSPVAVIVKAWRELVNLAKAYTKQVLEARNASLWGNGLNSMQQMTQIRTKQESKYTSAQSMMKEMAQAHDDWKETNNQESYNKFKILENRLDKLYHITFRHDRNGRIANIDSQIADKMKEFRETTLEAINGGIEQAQQVMNSTRQFLKDASYWDEVLDNLGGINSMQDAARAQEQAQQTIADLTEARTKIRAIDPSREFLRERNGAREQKRYEQAKKEREEKQKAEKERVKKLQEGTKKLGEWENSITDNERQKEYRSIMAKYNEAIEAGVKEEDARRVATEAITALLKKEKTEEEKKNKELLDAVQKKIDAYKQTYQKYLDAEKSLVDAKRQYADAQKDLAREAKSERIQRRREAIARKLSTFGFTLPEDFAMKESNKQRTARRRNRKNDASIGEKLAQWQEGKKVHWTKAERARLGEYQALQGKDKQLEAIQRQMDAAQQTESAAERLGSAADAVRDAALKFNDARDELKKARGEMDDAKSKQRTNNRELKPEEIFDRLKKGDYASVKDPESRNRYGYSKEEMKLREQERKMRRRQKNDIRFDNARELVVERAVKRRKRKESRGLRIAGTNDIDSGRGLRIGGVSSKLKSGQGLRLPRSKGISNRQLKGLKAPGLAGLQTKQINYSDSLSMIHRDLVEMARKTFRVR